LAQRKQELMEKIKLHVIFFNKSTPNKIFIDATEDEECAILEYGIKPINIDVKYPKKYFVVDAKIHAENAAKIMREEFPKFIWNFAKDSKLIDVGVLDDNLKLWWLLPISEKSELRVPFIFKVYSSLVLDSVINDNISEIVLHNGDEELHRIIQGICLAREIEFSSKFINDFEKNINDFRFVSLLKLFREYLRFLLLWSILKIKKNHHVNIKKEENAVALCTLYPAYFEPDNNGYVTKDILFSDFPKYLLERGKGYYFLTKNMFGIKDTLGIDKDNLSEKKIVILDAFIKAVDLMKIFLFFKYIFDYQIWRFSSKNLKITFRNIDLTKIILNELDREVYQGQSIMDSLITVFGIKSFLNENLKIKKLLYTFEFQPRERAIEVGTKMSIKKPETYGIQANVMIRNHLNWCFTKDELNNKNKKYRAVMPDNICVYSNVDYDIFKRNIQSDMLNLIGPLRHNQLHNEQKQYFDLQKFKSLNKINNEENVIFLALSVSKEESENLIHMAFSCANKLEGLFVLIKFHPLNRMHEEVESCACKFGFTRYKIFSNKLSFLIKSSIAVVIPSSSVGVYSIALGKMPIILYTCTSFTPFALRDYPDTSFFVSTEKQLMESLISCVNKDRKYLEKKSHWPCMNNALLLDNDGKSNERLHDLLFA